MKSLFIYFIILLPNILWGQSYFLKVKTQKLGEIKGECTIQRHLGKIEMLDYSFEIAGSKSSKKSGKPLIIRKYVDGTSALLYNAFFTNDMVSTLTIEGYQPKREGMEANSYIISCKNALILGIQQKFDPANNKVIEEIAFEISDFKFENLNNKSVVESKLGVNN